MRVRDSVRMLVFDTEQRLLLIQVRDGIFRNTHEEPGYYVFWHTPGGGIEPGETEPEAAYRELREETGIVACTPGPQVAYLEQTLMVRDIPTRFREWYYVMHTRTSEINSHGLENYERTVFREYRWWSVGELMSSPEAVKPAAVRELARDYLEHGDTGVRQIILA